MSSNKELEQATLKADGAKAILETARFNAEKDRSDEVARLLANGDQYRYLSGAKRKVLKTDAPPKKWKDEKKTMLTKQWRAWAKSPYFVWVSKTPKGEGMETFNRRKWLAQYGISV